MPGWHGFPGRLDLLHRLRERHVLLRERFDGVHQLPRRTILPQRVRRAVSLRQRHRQPARRSDMLGLCRGDVQRRGSIVLPVLSRRVLVLQPGHVAESLRRRVLLKWRIGEHCVSYYLVLRHQCRRVSLSLFLSSGARETGFDSATRCGCALLHVDRGSFSQVSPPSDYCCLLLDGKPIRDLYVSPSSSILMRRFQYAIR